MRKAVSGLVAITPAATGCGGGPPVTMTKVNYLTSFNTFGRDAYVYVAQEPGFFERAGLDLTITPGSGSVDGIGQFVVGKPLIEAAAKGRKVVGLPYGDLVPDLYGNALVRSAEIAKNKTTLVRQFRNALLQGLEYAIAHPDEVGPILKRYQPAQDAGAIPDGAVRPDDLASFALTPK